MDFFRVGRIANIVVGAWVLLSALAPSRSWSSSLDAAVVGVLSIVVAFGALLRFPALRFLNAALAVWLFVSAWIVHGGQPSTVAQDLLAATLMFGFAVIPPDPDEVPPRMGLRATRPIEMTHGVGGGTELR